MNGSALSRTIDDICSDVAPDIQEDIVSDITLEVLEHGIPDDLARLVRTYKDKNLSLYVKRPEEMSVSAMPTSSFGENRATRVIDESSEIPFEDRPVYYID
jgi:hypothetical protein